MAVEQLLTYSFMGSREKVKEDVVNFLEQTKEDEVMIVLYVYDHSERLKPHRLIAEVMRG